MNENPIHMQHARESRARFLLNLCARVQAGEVLPGVAVEALVCAGVDYEGAREAIDAAAKPEPAPAPAPAPAPKIGARVRVVEGGDRSYHLPAGAIGKLDHCDHGDGEFYLVDVEGVEGGFDGYARKVEVIP